MPFHPRNKHQGVYNLEQLAAAVPALQTFILTKEDGQLSLDFGQAQSIYLLNKALLATQYKIQNWTLPKDTLCPPVPSRADYIHHLAELLQGTSSTIPKGKNTKIIDIGTGASCIYPLLGTKAYAWSFVGVDSNLASIQWAHQFLAEQPDLRTKIELRWQKQPNHIFKGVVHQQDKFAASICNPPFFKSAKEAQAQQRRRGKHFSTQQEQSTFGGRANELYCEGGEASFVKKMILESQAIQQQVTWFTSLIAQERHLKVLYKVLKKVKARRVETIHMQHGNKKSRILCWSY